MGNTASGDDPDVAAVLATSLASSDPLLRAHAVWAAARLGRSDLLASLERDETDPMVVAELGARPAARGA
jgi:hypothetical protein